MMTQSIPTKAFGMIVPGASATNLAKGSRENGFEKLFAGSIKRETKFTVRAKAINENANRIKSPDKTHATDVKEKVMDTKQDNPAVLTDSVSKDTQTVDNMTKDEHDPVDLANMDIVGQILAMLDQIKNAIMEELELTPEELDAMMEKLGLEPSDLTDSQAIMQLVLTDYKASDPLAVLLNEELGDTFQGLLKSVNDIREQASPKLTDDDIKLILEQMAEADESLELFAADESETVQPLVSPGQAKDEAVEGKDKVIRFQTTSEDNEADTHGPVIRTSGDSELEDTKDGKTKSDKADDFEVFLDKLTANYDKPIVDFSNTTLRPYEIREIAQQIIEQIRVIINPEQTTMELQLNPEHLGKVNLTISSKEGVMTAHFAVQNDITKEAIESQLITLKDTLAQQGIKVETIEVTVASYTFDQNSRSDDTEQRMNKKQKTGHKITFEEAVAMSEEPIEEADAINLTDTIGYSIDYTA